MFRINKPATSILQICKSTSFKTRMYSAQPEFKPKKKTILDINKKHSAGDKMVMITAHDYPSAKAANQNTVDIVLVGDSLAMTILGYENTLELKLDEMIHHSKAVSRALSIPYLVSDLTFGSYNKSNDIAIDSAIRMHSEGHADCVKLEGGNPFICDRVRHIIGCGGVSVCGHIGLTPQSSSSLGGFRVQGKSLSAATSLIEQALNLELAGCSLIVLEAMPEFLAAGITKLLNVPTFGIGAGRFTSGQIAVSPDIANFSNLPNLPKFVNNYENLGSRLSDAIEKFSSDVTQGSYPHQTKHVYNVDPRIKDEIRSFFIKQYNIEI
ncbi:3-methyl-2-oxobutanoate hydroxymethyltransferase 2, mitochondrial [Smittium mucronatum]|uniref:3-methyl-2-oxobutanoate hydroxymethyltransferase n=1 Tax=Smittium mucronatum TaxID=133383 RepID=A0A1R0GQ76_9FUNG|nr:3-methyl-2-oxobutanoate hydroxymethyltransferase 2, mitochondrial [Smittium mucronatum]